MSTNPWTWSGSNWRNFTKAVRRAAFERCKDECGTPRCENVDCGENLEFRRYQFDHRVAWEVSRDSTLGNCQVLCNPCHLKKTVLDAANIAKARAIADRHNRITGAGKGNYPMRCGKDSNFKRTMSGRVIPRPSRRPQERRL